MYSDACKIFRTKIPDFVFHIESETPEYLNSCRRETGQTNNRAGDNSVGRKCRYSTYLFSYLEPFFLRGYMRLTKVPFDPLDVGDSFLTNDFGPVYFPELAN